MAWKISKAKRQALVKLQLRDKKGRWIEMGGGVKWYSSRLKKQVAGTVVGTKGENALVRLNKENPTHEPALVSVPARSITVVDSKASLAPNSKMGTPTDKTSAFEKPLAVANEANGAPKSNGYVKPTDSPEDWNVSVTSDGRAYIGRKDGAELYFPARSLEEGDVLVAPEGGDETKPFSIGKGWARKGVESVNTKGPKTGTVLRIEGDRYAVVQLPDGFTVEDKKRPGEQTDLITVGLSNSVIKLTDGMRTALGDHLTDTFDGNAEEQEVDDSEEEQSDHVGREVPEEEIEAEENPAKVDLTDITDGEEEAKDAPIQSRAREIDVPQADNSGSDDQTLNENGLTDDEQKLVKAYDRMADNAYRKGDVENAATYEANANRLRKLGEERRAGAKADPVNTTDTPVKDPQEAERQRKAPEPTPEAEEASTEEAEAKFAKDDLIVYAKTGKTYRVVAVDGDKLRVYRQNDKKHLSGDVGALLTIDADKSKPVSKPSTDNRLAEQDAETARLEAEDAAQAPNLEEPDAPEAAEESYNDDGFTEAEQAKLDDLSKLIGEAARAANRGEKVDSQAYLDMMEERDKLIGLGSSRSKPEAEEEPVFENTEPSASGLYTRGFQWLSPAILNSLPDGTSLYAPAKAGSGFTQRSNILDTAKKENGKWYVPEGLKNGERTWTEVQDLKSLKNMNVRSTPRLNDSAFEDFDGNLNGLNTGDRIKLSDGQTGVFAPRKNGAAAFFGDKTGRHHSILDKNPVYKVAKYNDQADDRFLNGYDIRKDSGLGAVKKNDWEDDYVVNSTTAELIDALPAGSSIATVDPDRSDAGYEIVKVAPNIWAHPKRYEATGWTILSDSDMIEYEVDQGIKLPGNPKLEPLSQRELDQIEYAIKEKNEDSARMQTYLQENPLNQEKAPESEPEPESAPEPTPEPEAAPEAAPEAPQDAPEEPSTQTEDQPYPNLGMDEPALFRQTLRGNTRSELEHADESARESEYDQGYRIVGGKFEVYDFDRALSSLEDNLEPWTLRLDTFPTRDNPNASGYNGGHSKAKVTSIVNGIQKLQEAVRAAKAEQDSKQSEETTNTSNEGNNGSESGTPAEGRSVQESSDRDGGSDNDPASGPDNRGLTQEEVDSLPDDAIINRDGAALAKNEEGEWYPVAHFLETGEKDGLPSDMLDGTVTQPEGRKYGEDEFVPALNHYIKNSFKSVNDYIRNGNDSEAATPGFTDTVIDVMDDAIANSPLAEDTTFFRGLQISAGEAEKFTAGSIISDKGFTSVSADRDIAGTFAHQSSRMTGVPGPENSVPVVLEVNLPKGHNALAVDYSKVENESWSMQQESVLGRDSAFKVDSVEVTDDYGRKSYTLKVSPTEETAPEAEAPAVYTAGKVTFDAATEAINEQIEEYGDRAGLRLLPDGTVEITDLDLGQQSLDRARGVLNNRYVTGRATPEATDLRNAWLQVGGLYTKTQTESGERNRAAENPEKTVDISPEDNAKFDEIQKVMQDAAVSGDMEAFKKATEDLAQVMNDVNKKNSGTYVEPELDENGLTPEEARQLEIAREEEYLGGQIDSSPESTALYKQDVEDILAKGKRRLAAQESPSEETSAGHEVYTEGGPGRVPDLKATVQAVKESGVESVHVPISDAPKQDYTPEELEHRFDRREKTGLADSVFDFIPEEFKRFKDQSAPADPINLPEDEEETAEVPESSDRFANLKATPEEQAQLDEFDRAMDDAVASDDVEAYDKASDAKYDLMEEIAARPAEESAPAPEEAVSESEEESSEPETHPLDALGIKRRTPEAVAGESYAPTQQQQDVIDAVLGGLDTKVQAMAGTGKTSTLVALSRRIAEQGGQAVYIAFNKTVQEEAVRRMEGLPVEPKTGHAVAHTWATKNMPHLTIRLGGNDPTRVTATYKNGKPKAYAKKKAWTGANAVGDALGIKAGDVKEESGIPKSKSNIVLAVKKTVEKFALSDSDTIKTSHVPEVFEIAESDLPKIVDFANDYWEDLKREDGNFRVTHDIYRKFWALSKPDLTDGTGGNKKGANILYIDEAQDTPPVLAKVVADQKMQKVIVGDANQAIYAFAENIDYLSEADGDIELPLNKSWRFGPEVADAGNRFLQMLGSENRVVGGGGPSKVTYDMENADAVLVRSNAGMIHAILEETKRERRVTAPDGTRSNLESLVESVEALKAGYEPENPHDDLIGFKNWDQVKAAYNAGDSNVRMIVKLFDVVDNYSLSRMKPEDIEKEVERKMADAKKAIDHLVIDVPGYNTVKMVQDGDRTYLEPVDENPYPVDPKTGKQKEWGWKEKQYAVKNFSQQLGLIRKPWLKDNNLDFGPQMEKYRREGGLETVGWKWERGKTYTDDPEVVQRFKTYSGESDVTVSTAHKSKGLEWDRVRIGWDFIGPYEHPKTGEMIWPKDDEYKLGYVALTRAAKEIDPGSLDYVFAYTQENGGDPKAGKRNVAVPQDTAPEPEQVADEAPVDVTPDTEKDADDALVFADPEFTPVPEVREAPEVTPEPETEEAPEEVTPEVAPEEAPGYDDLTGLTAEEEAYKDSLIAQAKLMSRAKRWSDHKRIVKEYNAMFDKGRERLKLQKQQNREEVVPEAPTGSFEERINSEGVRDQVKSIIDDAIENNNRQTQSVDLGDGKALEITTGGRRNAQDEWEVEGVQISIRDADKVGNTSSNTDRLGTRSYNKKLSNETPDEILDQIAKEAATAEENGSIWGDNSPQRKEWLDKRQQERIAAENERRRAERETEAPAPEVAPAPEPEIVAPAPEPQAPAAPAAPFDEDGLTPQEAARVANLEKWINDVYKGYGQGNVRKMENEVNDLLQRGEKRLNGESDAETPVDRTPEFETPAPVSLNPEVEPEAPSPVDGVPVVKPMKKSVPTGRKRGQSTVADADGGDIKVGDTITHKKFGDVVVTGVLPGAGRVNFMHPESGKESSVKGDAVTLSKGTPPAIAEAVGATVTGTPGDRLMDPITGKKAFIGGEGRMIVTGDRVRDTKTGEVGIVQTVYTGADKKASVPVLFPGNSDPRRVRGTVLVHAGDEGGENAPETLPEPEEAPEVAPETPTAPEVAPEAPEEAPEVAPEPVVVNDEKTERRRAALGNAPEGAEVRSKDGGEVYTKLTADFWENEDQTDSFTDDEVLDKILNGERDGKGYVIRTPRPEIAPEPAPEPEPTPEPEPEVISEPDTSLTGQALADTITYESTLHMTDGDLADMMARYADEPIVFDKIMEVMDERDANVFLPVDTNKTGATLDDQPALFDVPEPVAKEAAKREKNITPQQKASEEYQNYAMAQYFRAADELNGVLLNEAGKAHPNKQLAVDIFSGSVTVAHKYASEELLQWWRENGRETLGSFRFGMYGWETDRKAAETARKLGYQRGNRDRDRSNF